MPGATGNEEKRPRFSARAGAVAFEQPVHVGGAGEPADADAELLEQQEYLLDSLYADLRPLSAVRYPNTPNTPNTVVL